MNRIDKSTLLARLDWIRKMVETDEVVRVRLEVDLEDRSLTFAKDHGRFPKDLDELLDTKMHDFYEVTGHVKYDRSSNGYIMVLGE